MVTFVRVGSSTLYVESSGNPQNHGALGFLLPANTPLPPPQLTLDQSWLWANQAMGAGYYVFLQAGFQFPTPSPPHILNGFLQAIRSQFSGVIPNHAASFCWVEGNPTQPASILVRKLDLIGSGVTVNSRVVESRPLAQIIEFNQFQIYVSPRTRVRLLPNRSGFEITTAMQTAPPPPRPRSSRDEFQQLADPVAVYLRTPGNNVMERIGPLITIPLEGDGRGSLQFDVNALTPDDIGPSTIDLSCYYFLRPNGSGGTDPRALRYPLLDLANQPGGATVNMAATLYGADPPASSLRFRPDSGGNPFGHVSNFRTNTGHRVSLRPGDDGRLMLRPRPNLDYSTAFPQATYFYFAPAGDFELETDGPTDGSGLARLMAGSGGIEYVSFHPRNGTGSGDVLTFVTDQDAFAETFGDDTAGGNALLTDTYKTSWVRVSGENGAERHYFSQPNDAPLFAQGPLFSDNNYLNYTEVETAEINGITFPMVPLAGVRDGLPFVDETVDLETYRRFEQSTMRPVRDNIIKAATTSASPNLAKAFRHLAQAGVFGVTPQGMLVELDGNRYKKLIFAKLGTRTLSIDGPSATFQQALQTNDLFCVVSHRASLFEDTNEPFANNRIVLEGWPFDITLAATAAAATASIMVFKFHAASTLRDLVTDPSQWAEGASFNGNLDSVSDALVAIIDDVDDKAADQTLPAGVREYYESFKTLIVDDVAFNGILVFNAAIDTDEVPKQIKGLLPGLVDPTTGQISTDFKGHHFGMRITRVTDPSSGELDQSSIMGLIDYRGLPGGGATTDFEFRVRTLQVVFENSVLTEFQSKITIQFHKLFKEILQIGVHFPDATGATPGITSTDIIELTGYYQSVDGIPKYIFRFGCYDPVLNNWTVCENLGQVDISSRLVLAAESPVIDHLDVFRADFNVLQVAAALVTEVKSEFVLAGYMKMIELSGNDFFSYDTVPYTKLTIELKYEDGLPQLPIWDFKPEVMKFNAPRGVARGGSIVDRAPLAVKSIAESVTTFSAADVGVLPMPGLIPGSAAYIPYPSTDASPADYLIGYNFSVAPPWTGDSAGGLLDFTIHVGWQSYTGMKEAIETGGGTVPTDWERFDNYYTALQLGTPLVGLDIGKPGMFRMGVEDFGFGQIPIEYPDPANPNQIKEDQLFFIYINGFNVSILKWTSPSLSMLLFAPGAEFGGDIGSKIGAWFGMWEGVGAGPAAKVAVGSLVPIPVAPTSTTAFVLELGAVGLDFVRSGSQGSQVTLTVHGWFRNSGKLATPGKSVNVEVILMEKDETPRGAGRHQAKVEDWGVLPAGRQFTVPFTTFAWPSETTKFRAVVTVSWVSPDSEYEAPANKVRKYSNTVTLRKDRQESTNDSGRKIFALDFAAFGRGIRFPRGATNIRPAPRTVEAAIDLMSSILPSGESGPDLYTKLLDIYAPSAGWMIGLDMTIAEILRLAVVVNEADEIYGGLIELADADWLPQAAQRILGMKIQLIYRRVSDTSDLGVYEATWVPNDDLRTITLGAFDVTIPVISVAIYTDRSFLVDVGFPTGTMQTGFDFSRSLCIQGFIGPVPVIGFLGFYFGKLSQAAVPQLPDLNDLGGNWDNIWRFGVALKIGIGKAYRRGPVRFELSLTLQVALEGLTALWSPPAGTVVNRPTAITPDYFLIKGGAALVLTILGAFEVEKAGFRFSAVLYIRASAGFSFVLQTYAPTLISLEFKLEASLSISVKIPILPAFTVSFSFEFTYNPTLTIPRSGDAPQWYQFVEGEYPSTNLNIGDPVGGQPLSAGRSLNALVGDTIIWEAPGPIWGASFNDALSLLDITVADGETARLPVDLLFAPQLTVDVNGDPVYVAGLLTDGLSFRALQAGLLVWAIEEVSANGPSMDGGTVFGPDELFAIRAAFTDAKSDLSYGVLREFLVDNVAFQLLTAAEIAAADAKFTQAQLDRWNPSSGSSTVAVFPMIPELELTYPTSGGTGNVDFSTANVRDGSYFEDLNNYLESIRVRVEGDLDVPPTTGSQSFATYMFESFIEMVIESVVENVFEPYIPRATPRQPGDPTFAVTLNQLARDVLSDKDGIFSQIAALASRTVWHGHQLPEFDGNGVPASFAPISVFSGQQVPVQLIDEEDDEDADTVIWTATIEPAGSGAELFADDFEIASLDIHGSERAAIESLTSDVDNLLDVDDIDVIETPPLVERPMDYPLAERVPVSSGHELLRFPAALLNELSNPTPGRPFDDRINASVSTVKVYQQPSPVSDANFHWALVVPITATRVAASATAAGGQGEAGETLKHTYSLGGTDEANRDRIASLLDALSSASAPQIGSVQLQYKQSGSTTSNPSLDVGPGSAAVIKANLTTVSAPRRALAAAPLSRSLLQTTERFSGELTPADAATSLRLLWEASVVNAPGFYLDYRDGENGLPDHLFSESQMSADLQLVLTFSNDAVIPNYVNTLVMASGVIIDSIVVVTTPDVTSASPTNVPGSFSFLIGRQAPAASDDEASRVANLFNLLSYRVKDTADWDISSNHWSLPLAPLADTVEVPPAIASHTWAYQTILPVSTIASGTPTMSPDGAKRSPYDAVGKSLEIEIGVFDVFGNRWETVHTPAPIAISFNDPLIGVSQWPEAQAIQSFEPVGDDGTSGRLKVTLSFHAAAYDGTLNETLTSRLTTARDLYQTIWFQLQKLAAAELVTSLSQATDDVGSELSGWVDDILDYLNARLNDTTPSAPANLVLTSSTIAVGDRLALDANIVEVTAGIRLARDPNLVNPDVRTTAPTVEEFVSNFAPDATIAPDLPELPGGVLPSDSPSLIGYAQQFEDAFSELRLAAGENEIGLPAIWAVRIGPGAAAASKGLGASVTSGQPAFYSQAPLSVEPIDRTFDVGGEMIPVSNLDPDTLGRRFVSVVDGLLSDEQVTHIRDVNESGFERIVAAKKLLATEIAAGLYPIFSGDAGGDRETAAREAFRQRLLTSLVAAYDVDAVISYPVTSRNTNLTIGVTPPNLYGMVVTVEDPDNPQKPYTLSPAKISLKDGGSTIAFVFGTEHDAQQAHLAARLAFQVSHIEHAIEEAQPSWAFDKYRSSKWLKLIVPIEPLPITPGGTPVDVPIPLREIPRSPTLFRQIARPAVAVGVVDLDRAAEWEYELQYERPRAAQDLIYSRIEFNLPPGAGTLSLQQVVRDLIDELYSFDHVYSALVTERLGAGGRFNATDVTSLADRIEAVANTWQAWVTRAFVVGDTSIYDYEANDWVHATNEVIVPQQGGANDITIRVRPLPLKDANGPTSSYPPYPAISVPNSSGEPFLATPSPAQAPDPREYDFVWNGDVPDDQTRGLLFDGFNVLDTENARGRIWISRNENLSDPFPGRSTNPRFVYRSGVSLFDSKVTPFIDRIVPVHIPASVDSPSEQTLTGYLEQLFLQVFALAASQNVDWPELKLGLRYGHDVRGLQAPSEGSGQSEDLIAMLPIFERMPFKPATQGPSVARDLAEAIDARVNEWEADQGIATSPTRSTGFYELDLSVFASLSTTQTTGGLPVLRLRRLWIERMGS